MLDDLVHQFTGSSPTSMSGPELYSSVGTMLDQAPNDHVQGAVGEALSALGPEGFGKSIEQGAQNGTPQQQTGLASVLLHAVERGGGSSSGVLSQLGIGGQSMNPQELGRLAQYAHANHGNALSGVLAGALGGGGGASGGGGEIMGLLGNPMVQQIGMHLASRLIG